jgi:hypothetical protein
MGFWAAAIPVIGSVVGSLIKGKSAKKSANVQTQAADQASQASLQATRESNALLREFYYREEGKAAPFRAEALTRDRAYTPFYKDTLYYAGKSLRDLYETAQMEPASRGINFDPIYNQQKQGVMRALAAKGLRTGGAEVLAETGLRSAQAGRRTDILKFLANMGRPVSGSTTGATGNLSGLVTAMSQNIMRSGEVTAESALQKGAVRGSYYTDQGNVWGGIAEGAIGQIPNILSMMG